ncbi:DJ-1 family glyoxalase III [Fusibacter tunisiensis]|uniref:4-methyl-5(B-hydroxyethyl)-thiazole monophosphate biosynthesis n=1 Tax=Fusibacter tunisiensis TaxID=1008308 RepID=A0ABS2MQC6_9FIRM|nr:DJ-1 family glyoxalase III [Fusibacter tunisiensis]MBM7561589.1 4-methyl-5(b-hydroxyethyl)-thiazole monophosphate biosynthesis [Fusibacter tunisiensis]
MVYVFFADGFEEVEALSIVDVLRRADIDVRMVGLISSVVEGSHGIKVEMDDILADVVFDGSVEGMILPGGMPGTANLINSNSLKELLQKGESAGILIGAICAAPSALAAFNIYEGKRATCYPGFEHKMKHYQLVSDRVVVDGQLITGKGIGTALEFALSIVGVLRDDLLSATLAKNMIMK